jgi:hypothetical protein
MEYKQGMRKHRIKDFGSLRVNEFFHLVYVKDKNGEKTGQESVIQILGSYGAFRPPVRWKQEPYVLGREILKKVVITGIKSLNPEWLISPSFFGIKHPFHIYSVSPKDLILYSNWGAIDPFYYDLLTSQ